MSDGRDYKIDLSTMKPVAAKKAQAEGRPYLSVMFACCSVYQRIYRDLDGTGYRGRCPRCGRTVTFAVGASGTTNRFFVVS